jgi:hypothetical protein
MSRFHAQSVGGLDATYMSYRPSPPAHVRTRVDVSLLSLSDRACLRLLEYARVCTASQLASLVYPSLRTALRRTRKLSLQNLVTRESLPPERGGIPLAYRLSSSGRRRIHLNAYKSPGLITTRHSLDGVEFVASLVRHDPGLVQLWWPEWLIPGYDWGVSPDHLVVFDTGKASALILVEVDESTERPPVIRDRLRAYAKLFENHRVGWHLLWVANSRERLARLRQIAGPTKDVMLSGRCWGVAIDDVSDQGADAEVLAIGAGLEPRPLRGIATDPKARRTDYAVGSAAWISLLANGGKQDMDLLWQGLERRPAEVPDAVAEAPDDELSACAAETPEQVSDDALDAQTETTAEVEASDELRLKYGGELIGLILDDGGEGDRAARAFALLAERRTSSYLFDELDRMCQSGVSGQLKALAVLRRLPQPPDADDSYRRQARALLLPMVNGRNEQAVVEAALAALEALRPSG